MAASFGGGSKLWRWQQALEEGARFGNDSNWRNIKGELRERVAAR